MKIPGTFFRFILIILIISQGMGRLSYRLLAAEQKILIIEKSADPKDKTNHEDNDTNKPPGTTNTYKVSSLADCASQITAGLKEGDCIKELNFRGHGHPGNQGVGRGVNGGDGNKEIDTGDEEWKKDLEGLKGKFCADATINMWGCNVGAEDAGAKKLKEIADFFGVKVKGTVNTVYAGDQNTYDGPIQTAEPDKPQPSGLAPTDEEKAPKKGNEGTIPTLSQWAVIILMLLTLTVGTLFIMRKKTLTGLVSQTR